VTKQNLLGVDREQPSLFGSPDCGAVARESVDKLTVEGRRHYGEQFDSLLMCGGKATKSAQYGIDDRRRHAGVHGRGDQLADEVWVSVAEGVDLVSVQRAAGDKCAYGRLSESLRAEVTHLLGVRGVTEQLGQGVISGDLIVAVGE